MYISVAEAQAWGIVIGAMTTAAVSLITVFRVGKVHKLVNSAMAQEKQENEVLRRLLVSKQIELDVAERNRRELATAVLPVQPIVIQAAPPTIPIPTPLPNVSVAVQGAPNADPPTS